MSLFYDAEANPVGIEEAERLLKSRDRIVAQDAVNGLWVSTVHTVVDYNFGCDGPPLIYETALFGGDDGTVEAWRTPNRTAALAMHDQVCAAARARVST